MLVLRPVRDLHGLAQPAIGLIEAARFAQRSRQLRQRGTYYRTRGSMALVANAQRVFQEGDGALRLALATVRASDGLEQARPRLGLLVELALDTARCLVEQFPRGDFPPDFAPTLRRIGSS